MAPDYTKYTWWVKATEDLFAELSVKFCCSPAESLILVQQPLHVRPPGYSQVEVCVCIRERWGQWVSELRRCVTSTNPSSTSVCVSVRGWGSCLIWCASQMTSVCLLLVLCSQQRTQKELSLSESCILSFLASPLLFLWKCLLTFFPTSKLVCVLEHLGLTIFLFHLVPLSLSLGRCSLSTLTSFPRLASSPCCLPSSRQNQLKDQAQQALVSPGQLPEEAECLTVPKYKRDLVQKLKILRQELSQQQPQAGHCRIEVSREEIFEVRMEKKKQAQSCHHIVWSSQRVALIKDTAKWVHNLTPREIQLSEPEHAWNKLKCMTMKNMELM